jgi:hypothetical protein
MKVRWSEKNRQTTAAAPEVVPVKPNLNQRIQTKTKESQARLNRSYSALEIWKRVVQRANAAPCTTKVGSYMMKGRRLDVREGERR